MKETTAEIFMGWVRCLEEIETPCGHVNAFAFAAEHGLAYWMTIVLENASTREVDADFLGALKSYLENGNDAHCKRLCSTWLARHAISMSIRKGAGKSLIPVGFGCVPRRA